MTMMSDLSRDLVAKILSRVPITCLRTVRSTCKRWNAISRDRILCKAEAAQRFLGFMMKKYKLCSIRFNLRGIFINEGKEFVDPYIKEIGQFNQMEITKVFHCNGLLLCVTRDNTSLVVWNPYLGQTRWIQARNNYHRLDRYVLGYDNKSNHKILRFLDNYDPSDDFLDDYDPSDDHKMVEYEIYDFNSNSWKILDVTSNFDIEFYQRGMSLKGNSYFFAKEKVVTKEVGPVEIAESEDFLLCFDFTTESFGRFLHLPFPHYVEDTGTLSCVKDEKLAALYQNMSTLEMEIWVTSKIEPNAVSWIPFLKVDLKPLTGFQFEVEAGSFFIDEEKKVAVVFDLDKSESYNTACIIGEEGYFKEVDLGEAFVNLEESPYGRPLVCSYYVPSLVQINQGLVL